HVRPAPGGSEGRARAFPVRRPVQRRPRGGRDAVERVRRGRVVCAPIDCFDPLGWEMWVDFAQQSASGSARRSQSLRARRSDSNYGSPA
ncbi:hypothetical protein ACSTI1_00465, partial [Vibrio parahaemolyticus]